MKSILVTGGGGFVGGNFVRLALKEKPDFKITVVDKLGGREISPPLAGLKESYPERFFLERIDLNDKRLSELFENEKFDYVLHFAAKNPSGKDMGNPYEFAETNIERTAILLEEVRKAAKKHAIRFVHLSSYEVYGTMVDKPFTEDSPLMPTTPYAASKAGADLLSLAYHKTFGIDVISTRTTNIYGPFQSEDKFIPMVITKALKNEEIEVFGDGNIVRDWIYVDDHNRGVLKALEEGRSGEVYHIGANNPKSQIDVISEVLINAAHFLKKDLKEIQGLVKYEKGREAEDQKRTLNSEKITKELSFRSLISFEEGVKRTVEFFLKGKSND
jgi:dTDP-glucose 4,6-dehydratase